MIYQRVSDGKSFKVIGRGNSSVLAEVSDDHESLVENGEELDLTMENVNDNSEWREMH